MQNLKNVIVTGSNKGIGYAIVQGLISKEGWNVIMACRNLELANKSRDQLRGKFPNAHLQVQELDVSKEESIDNFVKVVAQKYKNIDILINNAGVAAKGDSFGPDIAEWTFATNFYGTISLTEKLLPALNDSGKIIIVGSSVFRMTRVTNEEIKAKLRNPDLTKQQLFALMEDFIEGVKLGNFAERGWPKSIYGVSKIGINHYAKVLSNYEEVRNRKIQAYSLCPGYCDTDMTSHKGPLTIQQGAETPIFLAELPFEVRPEWQGRFFEKCAVSSLE